ncbi:histidine acid phytase [Amniculicola lignicola CBS 123094]|uniref:3-phytase n=1 Tax=Amniculicola lignicola CBS 123094 TaxID=1392246 RepID=A0A6A5W0Q1_9PLEO|nr:histidine acid phytase [Amniculicola lignicola CBS 123094]
MLAFEPFAQQVIRFSSEVTTLGNETATVLSTTTWPMFGGRNDNLPLINSAHDSGWCNLSPWRSLSSADYSLPDASPLIPDGCTITQVHLLYRHGARYPTTGAALATFAQMISNVTKAGNLIVLGDLTWLSTWEFKLGAELLMPFGRSQNFILGVAHRQLYGQLLNTFTESGTIPIFRTESHDRMVKTAENFAAGFSVCNHSNIATKGSIGSTVVTKFAVNAFNATLARLNPQVVGFNFASTDAIGMLQLCSYETHVLGYSKLCKLFSQEDFLNYEYYYDLSFYYNNSPGSPYLACFTGQYPSPFSVLNETFDNSSTYFPFNQSIYADATHEVVVLDTLTAFNLTALFDGPPLTRLVPFATHFTTQILSSPAYKQTKQLRFIVDDAFIPLHESYPGCPEDANGLCAFDAVVDVLTKWMDEIDFNYDCFANYTAVAGIDYNGRAPHPQYVGVRHRLSAV